MKVFHGRALHCNQMMSDWTHHFHVSRLITSLSVVLLLRLIFVWKRETTSTLCSRPGLPRLFHSVNSPDFSLVCDCSYIFHAILSESLSPSSSPSPPCVCDLSIIFYIKCVLSAARIHNIVAFLFYVSPSLPFAKASVPRSFIQIAMVCSFFFSGLSRLITCDHPTIKAAAIELPWQHLVHAVTATAESAGRQRHTLIYKHTHTTVALHHTGNPCSFVLTASGSVKVIIDLPSQSQRS